MELDCDSAIQFALETLGKEDFRLKDIQKDAITAVLNNKDTFVQVPTGYGKSLIYQVLPYCFDFLYDDKEKKNMVIIVSPLKALLDDQIDSLQKCGCSVLNVKDTTKEEVDDIKKAKYNFIYTTPESIVNNSTWKEILMSDYFQKHCKVVVVDEAHCLIKWAKFRNDYQKINEVSSLLPRATILALTATITSNGITKISEILCMRPGSKYFRKSMVKENIYYELTNQNMNEILVKLSKEVYEKRKQTERTVIYSTSLLKISQYYLGFGILLQRLNIPESERDELFGVYCSVTRDDMKESHLKSLQTSDGSLRIIFASSAFGLGVDAKSITRIIHDSCPETLDDYLQETGRAGRGGERCLATLRAKKTVHTDPKMQEYLKISTCRRNFFLHHYFNIRAS